MNERHELNQHGVGITVIYLCHATPLWELYENASLGLITAHCVSCELVILLRKKAPNCSVQSQTYLRLKSYVPERCCVIPGLCAQSRLVITLLEGYCHVLLIYIFLFVPLMVNPSSIFPLPGLLCLSKSGY